MSSRTGRAAILSLALIASSWPGGARSQVTEAPAPPPPAAAGEWAAVAAVPHPWSTVVAVTVALPVGSSSDPSGLEGSFFLLGEAVRAAVLRTMGPGTLDMAVEVDRSGSVYRVLVVPDRWPDAFRALDDALFDGEVDEPAFAAAREALAEVFVFESGAPIREFETEAHLLMAGLDAPWSRPIRGTTASLERIGLTDLLEARRRHVDRGRAVVSVTGAVDAGRVFDVVAGTSPPTGGTPGEAVVATASAASLGRPEGEAWDEEARTVMVRDVTNTWIAVGWPVDDETSSTALEMLIHRIDGSLDTSPPDPGVFSVSVDVEDLDGHRILFVEAAVLPEAAARWEERILASVAGIAAEELEPGFFRWQRRRFRNDRFLREAAPEAEGLRLATDLLREGRIRDLTEEIWALTADDLAEAAGDLGPPRILVFGPDLSDGGSR